MSFWEKLFGRASRASAPPVAPYKGFGADMHSHVLPGLDDGSDDLATSLELLRELRALGYRKLIATPHIMGDFYKNTPEGIRAALARVQEAATNEGIDLVLECAAEYYLDEWFMRRLERQDELLTFGGAQRYILIETSYINESRIFNEALFELKAAGYRPVIAHPERYKYLHTKMEELTKWHEKGALLQLNLNSLTGYYGQAERHVAEHLIEKKMVSFVGTDCHGHRHVEVLVRLAQMPILRKLMALPLLNIDLLDDDD